MAEGGGGFMQLGDAFYIVVRHAQPLDEDINPRLHYDNYYKDIQCFQYYGCSRPMSLI